MIRRARARRSSGTIEMPVSSLAMPITAAPCFLTSGRMRSMRSSSAVTELTSALPSYADRPASRASMIEESMQMGRSQTSITALIVATRSAGSSIAGMPALMSSMCAPAAACAMASARTRSIFPVFISAARTLRPVGLMRSPMITKGRSPETTTSRPRELRRVSIRLTLLQGLVDQLYGLLQRVRALRRVASIPDQLLRHPGGHRGVGRVAVRTNVLGVFLGHRRAANRDVHLVPESRLGEGLDVDLEHRHRGREEGGETHDIGLVVRDGLDKLLGRRVHAKVEHFEACALEHDHAKVLADVVDVPLHGADHVPADRLGARLSDQRPQDYQRALHRTSGDEHLRDEEVALFEAAAYLFEGGDEGFEEDVHQAHHKLKTLFGESLDLRRVPVERVGEQSGPDLFFSAHAAPPGCWHGSSKAASPRLLRIAQQMLRVQQFTRLQATSQV